MMRIQKIFGYSSPQHSWNKGLHFELLASTLFLEFAQIPGATRSSGPRKSKGQSLNHVFHPIEHIWKYVGQFNFIPFGEIKNG